MDKWLIDWFVTPTFITVQHLLEAVLIIQGHQDKSLALPSDILGNILQDCSDAQSVVVHLRERLKLEDSSLRKPDLETKRWIRSLARKARLSTDLMLSNTSGKLYHLEPQVGMLLTYQMSDINILQTIATCILPFPVNVPFTFFLFQCMCSVIRINHLTALIFLFLIFKTSSEAFDDLAMLVKLLNLFHFEPKLC